MIYKSNIRYIFCEEPFKVFLEGQMSVDKSTSLLAIKHYTLFKTYSSFSTQQVFSVSGITSH